MVDNSNCNCIELKEVLRAYATTSCLKIDCDDTIKCVREEVDIEKFKNWFEYNLEKFKSKTNQSSYFKKSFITELEKGTFKPLPKVYKKYSDSELLCSVLPTLYKHLGAFGIDMANGFGDETFFVENLQIYIIQKKILSIDELNELNDRVMSYITSLESPKLTDYRIYIKKAQALKDKVNWAEVERIEKKERKAFDELMSLFKEDEITEEEL